MANSGVGTAFKLNINMEPIDNYHMEDVEWEAKVFTELGKKSVSITKDNAIKVNKDNYMIVVDSSVLGAGNYYITLTAMIPDGDIPSGRRQEVKTAFTGVTIDAR